MSLSPGPAFTTLHILITYRLDQYVKVFGIDMPFCLVLCKLIGLIRKVQRKCNVVNMVPELTNMKTCQDQTL
jgi:hypothetical protein